jgi:aldose 1-epimerase
LVSDSTCTPTGEIRSVENSPFDFREPKAISRDIGADYETLRLQLGYDHCYLNETPMCAQLLDPDSGRCMQVFTDMPGVQLFSGNDLNLTGKGNTSYPAYSGICLETQYYPDAINHPQWPQPILRAGKIFQSTTSYVFTAE